MWHLLWCSWGELLQPQPSSFSWMQPLCSQKWSAQLRLTCTSGFIWLGLKKHPQKLRALSQGRASGGWGAAGRPSLGGMLWGGLGRSVKTLVGTIAPLELEGSPQLLVGPFAVRTLTNHSWWRALLSWGSRSYLQGVP